MEMNGRSCFLAKRLEIGQAGHLGLVLGDDLAQHAGRRQPGGAGQVDRRLRVAGPLEHATGPVAQREDVARPVEVVGPGGGVDQGGDGRGPVRGGDPRRGPVPVVDAHGERRALGLGVRRDHQRQLEQVGPLGQQRDADDARGVGEEEGDVLRRGRLGRHDQVALVLPVLVVDDDGHAQPCDGVDGFLHLRERHQAATSTRRSSPSCSIDTSLPFHTSPIVPAPGPAKIGRPSSPPKNTGARYRTYRSTRPAT